MGEPVLLLGALTIPGQPEYARAARMHVVRSLGEERAVTEIAVLLTSELVSNSMKHSRSRQPGGLITITLLEIASGVRAEVADAGGPTLPAIRAAGSDLESGRGLFLVGAVAARWGFQQAEGGLVTWFELADAAP